MNTKRGLLFFIGFLLFSINCFSQNEQADSLLALLKNTKEDTLKVNLLNDISKSYFNTSPEEAFKYATQAKDLSEKKGYKYGLAYALKNIGISYYMQSNYVETLANWNQSLTEFEAINDKTGIANILSNLGAVYFNKGDDAKALDYYTKSLKYSEEIADTLRIVTALNNIGAVYYNKPATHDKSLNYYLRALPLCELIDDKDALGTTTANIGEIYFERGNDTLALQYFERAQKAYEDSKNVPFSLNEIGKVYEKRGDYARALQYHNSALETAKKLTAKLDIAQSYLGLASTFTKKGDVANAINAYKQAQLFAKDIGAFTELKTTYEGLSKLYASTGDFANAYNYQRLLTDINDTLYNYETDKQIAVLNFMSQIQQKQAEINSLTNEKTLKDLDLNRQTTVKNSLIAMLSMVTVIVFILFRNYRIKSKTNTILDRQKQALEKTINELKTTQAQLIQSEKMASLGELTAGIAHEIQNPLNFMNNFSEVNNELIEELKNHVITKNQDTDEHDELLKDIVQNNEKIIFHGKRADSIVKGMLQHSRKNTGQKEATDINALCDEYLRLSYHGLRAKDKVFNTDIKTDFDESIGKIDIVPQDIGRVLINLFNNAFYAVNEKKKTANETYKPLVSVRTKKLNDTVEIRIADNGKGIPQNIIDKIFQPFFTTKPTGQGTGLGLSLAYDIITKEHGGTIKVKSDENEGTEFLINLKSI